MPVLIIAILIMIAIPASRRSAREAMQKTLRADLERLATAQGEHHRRFRRYATRYGLEFAQGVAAFEPARGNDVRILFADAAEWSATAERRTLGVHTQCVVRTGETTTCR